ncbi:MAG: hypothetical protein V1875_00850 [Candidatus Altiarchaeota archaeon]
MPKRSVQAQARHEETKQAIQSELEKYEQIVRELRTSTESTLARTHKQKEYHRKILELQQKLQSHGH